MDKELIARVSLDWATYRRFSVFDRFILTGLWRRPAWFAAAFVGLSFVSFLVAASGKRGAWLLGGVLLALGLILPGAYLGQYIRGLRRMRARFWRQNKSRFAYSLSLAEDPLALVVRVPGQEQQAFSWKKIHGVWHRGDVVYLYVEPGKAYILPLKQLPGQEAEALAFLREAVPAALFHP